MCMALFQDALSALDASFQTLNPVVLDILSAILILFVGIILGKIMGNLLRKLFQAIGVDVFLSKLLRFRVRIQAVLAGLVALAIYVLTVILALQQANLLNILVAGLSYVIILLVLASILLALKDMLPNLVMGWVARRKLRLRRKQQLSFGTYAGVVEEVSLLDIKLRTPEGELLLVPYSVLMRRTIHLKKKG